MLALETLATVALMAVSGFLTAAVTGFFGWLPSRKPRHEREESMAERAHRRLIETIEWDDKEIAELRAQIDRLKDDVRRLESELRGRP